MKENNIGRILAIDTGSTSTKVGYFVDGKLLFEEKLIHTAEEVGRFKHVMDQDKMRRDAIMGFLHKKNIALQDLDIIMARGGLFAPVRTGVYRVNRDMRDVLLTCRDGTHACNLSAVIADDIAERVNEVRHDKGLPAPFGLCHAYIADPPMADEMLPECRLGGIPEFPRRAFFHALNSRATTPTTAWAATVPSRLNAPAPARLSRSSKCASAASTPRVKSRKRFWGKAVQWPTSAPTT